LISSESRHGVRQVIKERFEAGELLEEAGGILVDDAELGGARCPGARSRNATALGVQRRPDARGGTAAVLSECGIAWRCTSIDQWPER
jgi:hypothetical protein